jgi:hypothetical protein
MATALVLVTGLLVWLTLISEVDPDQRGRT